ncbi:lysM and putative peptidoglycan-binding domain-containing protein 2 isoform X2 [Belonocnema kinseyi]|uniref:lysM and putative peptidoglycan-binding domain-containing protein 2 isoform X2 n=1 Tax=Belonocnema kinseyi TaxID=2817044 RepID=UPI00143D4F22|nr:lysM and putative peptidoglycan-binding domain-containing protein 2 isoform X2 [Belonocnema kinseyi]
MERYNDDEMEERRSIRNSGKALKKYGSTAKHMKRHEILVKHAVSKTDTLQGIALKFGVTTEQIRRANRLWATDSLFLREYLLIPVPVDNPLSMQSNDASTESESNHTMASTSRSSSMASSLDQESSVDDFLARMDSSIASVKKEVKRAQGNNFVTMATIPTSRNEKPSQGYATQTQLPPILTHLYLLPS